MTARFRLVISYLGSRFHGWQVQENACSVQGEIEARFWDIFSDETIRIIASGRTDTGVHAAGQVAHVDLPNSIPSAGLIKALNGRLPEDIRVLSADRTSPDFHARFDAKAKTYCYRIRWIPSKPAPPWKFQRTAFLPKPTNIKAMIDALAALEGEHDFASFTIRDPKKTGRTQRQIFSTQARSTKAGLHLVFRGSGFLRYQVRRMVGALLEIGNGKHDAQWLGELLSSPQPGAGVYSAPPRGLCLEKVEYDSERAMVDSSTDFGAVKS